MLAGAGDDDEAPRVGGRLHEPVGGDLGPGRAERQSRDGGSGKQVKLHDFQSRTGFRMSADLHAGGKLHKPAGR